VPHSVIERQVRPTDAADRVPTTKDHRSFAATRRIGVWVVVTAVAIACTVLGWSDVAAAGRALRHADFRWLVAALALGALVVVNLAGLQSRAQGLLGVRRPFRQTLHLTAGAHALDLVTKSGGMAGALRFGADARRRGQSVQRATAGCVLAELSTHLGFTAALAAAVPIAIRTGRLTTVDVVGITIYLALTGLLLAGVVAAARSRRAIRRITAVPQRMRALLRCNHRQPPHPPDHRAADDLHLAITVARQDRAALGPIAVHAVLWPLIGMALLWTVCAGVGVGLGVEAVAVTYCLGTTFSIIGLLPGGLGFAELSMGATLTAFGVDAGHAVAVIALYRLFDLWLPVTVGALTLRRTRAGADRRDCWLERPA
jgi:uncharacterized protein (TIRG00374 family)